MSIFDNVKSKLGFSGGNEKWDDRYDDGYGDYGGYEDGYDGGYDDYDDYEDGYDDGYDDEPKATQRVSSRTRSDALRPGDLSVVSRRDNRPIETTPLVTNSDVRAKSYESLSSRQDNSKVSSKPDYETSLQAYDIKPRETLGRASHHSEESLELVRSELESLQKGAQAQSNGEKPQGSKSDNGGVKHLSTVSRRIVTIIPTSYADVEKVSKAFRNGSSAVVSLSVVSPALACRILDFSFGVVSVSGGIVEKIGDKVFFLSHAKSAPISESERQQLKDAGVL